MTMNLVQEAADPPVTSGIQRFDLRGIEAECKWFDFRCATKVGFLPFHVRGKSLFRPWSAAIVNSLLFQRLSEL